MNGLMETVWKELAVGVLQLIAEGSICIGDETDDVSDQTT